MSIPYVPPQDDSLDIHVEDLDSFELSDVYMSDGDAETKIFGSNHSSSSCEPDSICVPDTTTSPPSKIKLQIQADSMLKNILITNASAVIQR